MPHDAAAYSAPELDVSQWFNTGDTPTLAALRGQVVLLHAFQMLCPACVSHGLPQAARLHEVFGEHGVAVIGLHTVFEHHAVMGEDALQAFIHEYRLRFAIGVDRPSADGPIPHTMARWELQGTPSTLVLDRSGHVRLHHFGALDELRLGALIGQLLAQAPGVQATAGDAAGSAGCADGACEATG